MEHLGSRIKQLSNAYERLGNRMLQRQGMTFAQAEILRLVLMAWEKGEPLNQKGIENALRLKNPTVTGTLNRLEAKALIRRVSDPRDGRCKLIEPTDKALEQHAQTGEAFRRREAQLLSGISPQEQRQLIDLLDRVLRNIERIGEDEDE